MAHLAEAVAARLGPGWAVRGATLAAPGALEQALSALPTDAPLLVHPHFMAEGWFTREALPERLRAAGAGDFQLLPAFGSHPGLPALALARARAALAETAHAERATGLLVAAHGHPSDPRAAAAARAFAAALAEAGNFREIAVGFIDEAPGLADAARALAPPALCLPFFALTARHVAEDIPAALAEAGFEGPLLGPLGEGPGVEALVVDALLATLAGG